MQSAAFGAPPARSSRPAFAQWPARPTMIQNRLSVVRRIDAQRSSEPEKVGAEGVDRLIARLAADQYGVVGMGQLLDLGISRDRVRGRIRRGRLHRIHRGVYAVGHRVLSREGHWTAAILGCGTGTCLSHRSAAECWGLLRGQRAVVEVTSDSGLAGAGRHRRPCRESAIR